MAYTTSDSSVWIAQSSVPSSQANSVDLITTESAHFTGEVLKQIAAGATTLSLKIVDTLLVTVGQAPDEISAGVRSLIAFFLLLGIVGSVVWWSPRLIRAYLTAQRGSGLFLLPMVLISLIRPLQLLIWIYGGFVAGAPLLIYVEGHSQLTAAQIFGLWHYGIVASSIIGGVWFISIVLTRLRNRSRAWAQHQSASLGITLGLPLLIRCLEMTVPLLAVVLFFQLVPVPSGLQDGVTGLSLVMTILLLAWVLGQLLVRLDDIILSRFDISAADNLRARTIYTQVYMVQRISLFILGLVTFAGILLVFPNARQLGQALLASAGAAGIIIGFALQKTFSNLFAGILIAFTQPIRLDDAVVVEGEWGWIEEITLTYVVIKIWDWRRLVLPISYFIERPFQNWTRASASIIGTIFMYVDYTIPVPRLRSEFEAIVKNHPLWDGRVYCLQVTELKERTVELRVLVSAVNSPKAFDLRCDVREAMLKFVQHHYPECLPVFRLDQGKPIPANGQIDPNGSESSKHLMADEIRDIEI